MTRSSPESAFTEVSTRLTLKHACRRVGLDGDEAELVRLGENAVYRLTRAPVVVRIGRGPEKAGDAAKELRVARWLEGEQYPSARASAENGDEPLVIDDAYPVTFWHLIRESAEPPDDADLGGLLRELHDLEPPEWVGLPQFDPFASVPERLQSAPTAADPADVAELREADAELRERYSLLTYALPPGPIHGDAHLGNLIRDESGKVILLDLEIFAMGHREWDLAVTGVRHAAFGWVSDESYRSFCEAYGFDVLTWEGFPVFRGIRELTMTTWLMQLVDDPRAAKEFHHRVSEIRSGNFPRTWSVF